MPPVPQTAQPPPQQSPPQDDDGDLIAVIVAALAAYWTVDGLTRALRAPFKAAGIAGQVVPAVAALVLSWPQSAMEGTGPAQRWAVRTNLLRRAQFFLAAAKRTNAAVKAARSRNLPVMAAIRAQLAAEQRHLSAHVAASTQRVQAAGKVDAMAAQVYGTSPAVDGSPAPDGKLGKHGGLLGWQAVLDPKCSPGCAAADHCNFYADRPPMVEGHPAFPGAVHGTTCRCIPVPPWPGAKVLR